MKVIYLLSDLHGNLPALNAVIKDIGVNEFTNSVKLFLGDYIDFGPYPNEIINKIKILDNAHFVVGNHDQYIFMNLEKHFEDSIYKDNLIEHMNWTKESLSHENKKWICNLPVTKKIKVNSFEILMCHGNVDDTEQALSGETIKSISSKIIITGHIHAPYYKIIDEKIIINPGSVGESLDKDNRASYSMIIIDGDEINVINKRVSYDIDIIELELNKRNVPWKNEIIRGIREACLT